LEVKTVVKEIEKDIDLIGVRAKENMRKRMGDE